MYLKCRHLYEFIFSVAHSAKMCAQEYTELFIGMWILTLGMGIHFYKMYSEEHKHDYVRRYKYNYTSKILMSFFP